MYYKGAIKESFCTDSNGKCHPFCLGCYILIGMMHMGPFGAAIATTAAEWTCALSFFCLFWFHTW